jgi:hypothetical protein
VEAFIKATDAAEQIPSKKNGRLTDKADFREPREVERLGVVPL